MIVHMSICSIKNQGFFKKYELLRKGTRIEKNLYNFYLTKIINKVDSNIFKDISGQGFSGVGSNVLLYSHGNFFQ